MSKFLKSVKENTYNIIGFILHNMKCPKWLGSRVMSFLEDYFWPFSTVALLTIIMNIFIP